MALYPTGGVSFFEEACYLPLSAMLSSACVAIIDAAQMMNVSFLEVQRDWIEAGRPSPAPVQYAISHASVHIKCALHFNSDQQAQADAVEACRNSLKLADPLPYLRGSSTFGMHMNPKNKNRFNVQGEFVSTIDVEIAPVYAPTASGAT